MIAAVIPARAGSKLIVGEGERLEFVWPENPTRRPQDLPEALNNADQFYWIDTERYLCEPRLFGSNSVAVVLPQRLVQDLDTPKDWERAELRHAALRAEKRGG